MNDVLRTIVFLVTPNVLAIGMIFVLQTRLLKRGTKPILCAALAVIVSLLITVVYLQIAGSIIKSLYMRFFDLDATGLASISFAALFIWLFVATLTSIFVHMKFSGVD